MTCCTAWATAAQSEKSGAGGVDGCSVCRSVQTCSERVFRVELLPLLNIIWYQFYTVSWNEDLKLAKVLKKNLLSAHWYISILSISSTQQVYIWWVAVWKSSFSFRDWLWGCERHDCSEDWWRGRGLVHIIQIILTVNFLTTVQNSFW